MRELARPRLHLGEHPLYPRVPHVRILRARSRDVARRGGTPSPTNLTPGVGVRRDGRLGRAVRVRRRRDEGALATGRGERLVSLLGRMRKVRVISVQYIPIASEHHDIAFVVPDSPSSPSHSTGRPLRPHVDPSPSFFHGPPSRAPSSQITKPGPPPFAIYAFLKNSHCPSPS